MNPVLKTVLASLKPVLNSFLASYVFPEIQALEDKIGNDAVKALTEKLTQSAEAFIEEELQSL